MPPTTIAVRVGSESFWSDDSDAVALIRFPQDAWRPMIAALWVSVAVVPPQHG